MSELAVDVQGLTRRFGDFVAVDGATFQIERGAIFGFLGPNGAGKSTTIRMLLGILPPSEGDGTVLGRNLRTQAEEIRARVGYMSQKFSLYQDLTVLENLRFFGGVFALPKKRLEERIDELVEMTRLQGYENTLAAQLPGGIRQRLSLATSLLHDPELVFLDEPTGAVDPALRRYFWERIAGLSAQGKTVMVTSHYMDEVERCHEICFINRGAIIARGSPSELKRDNLHGTMWQVETKSRNRIVELLESLPQVASAFPSGTSVRFLLRPDEEVAQVERELRKAGLSQDLHQSDATLEDVFVSLAAEVA